MIGKVEDIKGQRVAVTISHKIAKHDGIQIDIIGKEKPYGFSLQKIMVKKKFVIEAKEGDIVEICLPEKVKGLKVGADVYLASSSEVKGAYGYQKPKLGEFRQRIPIDVCVEIKENEIIADARGKRFVIEGCFEKAHNISRMNDVVKGAFAKTGETEFVLGNLDINNKEGLFVPISILNELRRGLYEQIVPDNYQMPAEYIEARKVISDAKWIIKTDDVDNLSLVDLSKVDEIIFLINENTILSEVMKLPKNKVRIALPTVCRKTKDFDPIINKLIEAGYKKWEISNYWGLSVLPLKKIDLSFDNLIYMFNLEAMQMAKEINISRVTLPIEDCLSNLYETAQAAPLPITMIVYQDVPLFTSAVCIRENSCKECSKKTEWLELEKDGVRYKALSKNCQLMLFNERVFCAAREAKDIKADFYRVDFCYKKYSTQEVKDILQSVVNFEDVLPCIKGNLLRKNEMF